MHPWFVYQLVTNYFLFCKAWRSSAVPQAFQCLF